MSNIIEICLSKSHSILINLPCEKEHINLFSNISIKYIKGDAQYDLYINDYFSVAIKSLFNVIGKAIKSELQIASEYIEKGIGYYHNNYSHKLWASDNLDIDDPSDNFILWSTPSNIGIETYIYNIKNEIFIEISPIYKWNSEYPECEKEYETFEEFIKKHCPIEIINIDRNIALQLQKDCEYLLNIATINTSV